MLPNITKGKRFTSYMRSIVFLRGTVYLRLFALNWSVKKIACTKLKYCGSISLEHGWMDDMSEKNKNGTLYLNAFFKPMIKQNKWKIYHILSPCKPKKFSKLLSKLSYYRLFHQLIFPSINYLKNVIPHACIKMQRGTVVHFYFIVHCTKNVFEILHYSCSSLWPLYIILDHLDKNDNLDTLSHSRLR